MQVEQAAGCRHKEVDALAQWLELLDVGDTAVDGENAMAGMPSDGERIDLDLCGELARRGDHESADLSLGRNALHRRQNERSGFTSTGLRACEQIVTPKRDRDRLLLDRCGLVVAESLHTREQVVVQSEHFELHGPPSKTVVPRSRGHRSSG